MRTTRSMLRPRVTLALILGSVAILSAVSVSSARQSEQSVGCTLQTIAGEYGFRTTGVLLRPDGSAVSFASIGRYVRDGQGNVTSGEVTSNAGGSVMHHTLTGTYTVNPDCTGSQTSNLETGSAVNTEFVIVNHGETVEFVTIEGTASWGGTQTKQ